MVLSRNDSRILFGNKQGTISVWDFKERRGLALLATPTLGNLFKYLIYDQEHITCLEPVQGGRRVLVGGSSGVLYEWRMDHYKLIWKNKKAHKSLLFVKFIDRVHYKYLQPEGQVLHYQLR